ncbi:MAG TPA: hypothetical protein VEH31_27465 [Streptosporangiaceae bacterium]|nr:hypothetical protein [Streptosporangiaceae bacterium]
MCPRARGVLLSHEAGGHLVAEVSGVTDVAAASGTPTADRTSESPSEVVS